MKAIKSAVKALLRQKPVAQFVRRLYQHTVSDDEWLTEAQLNLIKAAQLGFLTQERRVELFLKAEKFGAHFLPVHFYSPVPEVGAIKDNVWKWRYDHLPRLFPEDAKIESLLTEIGAYAPELESYKQNSDEPLEYGWVNPAFCPGDGASLYTLVRHFKPNKVLEIGSGYSSLLVRDALKKNGKGKHVCVEPFPMDFIKSMKEKGDISLIDNLVQDVPLSTFEELEAGDILFIDSTHVAKIGSDVIYEILYILPCLKPGVIVHIHDIFLPLEYPEHWVKDLGIYWNEQYILAAFMAYNNSFETLLPNMYITDKPDLLAKAQKLFGAVPYDGGGSFWFKKIQA